MNSNKNVYPPQYSRDNKQQFYKGVIITTFISLCLFIALIVFYDKKIIPSYVKKATNGKYVASFNGSKEEHINVVRAKVSLIPGDSANPNSFEVVSIPASLAPENCLNSLEQLKEKRIQYPINVNGYVCTNYLSDETSLYVDNDKITEHTFQPGSIPDSVIKGSIIDIKLYKQGSEDLFVVAKKTVINKVGDKLTFYLDNTEQEYLKEAANEGLLYAVQYIDAGQPESKVTYSPKFNTSFNQ